MLAPADGYNAEDHEHAATAFAEVYGAKWPKAVARIAEHLDLLLAFYERHLSAGVDFRALSWSND